MGMLKMTRATVTKTLAICPNRQRYPDGAETFDHMMRAALFLRLSSEELLPPKSRPFFFVPDRRTWTLKGYLGLALESQIGADKLA